MSCHHKTVCQYGFTHSQCRCPALDKSVITINCPSPGQHHTQLTSDQADRSA